MSQPPGPGMSPAVAFRIEAAIIGLGVVALAMIFQPFSLAVFTLGCILVVCAALANNMLPFAQAGQPLRKVIFAGVIVLMIFCIALVVSIAAAHLYGVVFLKPPPAGTSLAPPAPPFWRQPLVWGLAAVAAALALVVRAMTRR
ncbi:hypothetical protein [Amaricoccus sp.]|uniref:hypothetical protein n=1 Tax=Amaricoccus sp. TaxID=1872485 RepID=UPI001B4C2E0C|nr:hypothetical protein [Amaricoccus sp.]MBP7000101.1 hypothetical protein [Amaricoccus sp.]